MNRVTMKDLEQLVKILNKRMNRPEVAYIKGDDGKLITQAGHFMVDGAYGGYRIEEMYEGGGVTVPFGHARKTKRELYDQLSTILDTIDMMEVHNV